MSPRRAPSKYRGSIVKVGRAEDIVHVESKYRRATAEPAKRYVMIASKRDNVETQYFLAILPQLPDMTDLEKAHLIEQPIQANALEQVRRFTGASVEDFQTAMAMTPATWKRRMASRQELDLQERESLLRISQVTALAERIVGRTANEWLREGHPHLDGQTPLAACRTEPGGRAVESMLWSIDAGHIA